MGLAGGGGGRGSEIQKSEQANVNTHSIWGVSGGGGRGSEIQKSEKAHVNTHTHMHIHLQRVVGQLKIAPCDPGELGEGVRGSEIQKSEKHMSDVLEMGVPAIWPP